MALLFMACSKPCDSCTLAIQNTGQGACMVRVGNGEAFTMEPGAVEFARIIGESVNVSAQSATGNTVLSHDYQCGQECGVVRVLIP